LTRWYKAPTKHEIVMVMRPNGDSFVFENTTAKNSSQTIAFN
jgi:hypothetical protein